MKDPKSAVRQFLVGLVVLTTIEMLPNISAESAELRVAPSDQLLLFSANSNWGIFDLVVPAIGIRSKDGETVKIDRLRLELWRDDEAVLIRNVGESRLLADTARLADAPASMLVVGGLLDAAGLVGFFGMPTELSTDASLTDGESLVTTAYTFVVDFMPEFLRIVVEFEDRNGVRSESERRVPIQIHESTIKYRLPLQGPWLMTAYPSVHSHHRLFAPTEFAVDFFRIDRGRLQYGDRSNPNSYFGYGSDVTAAADGEVVRVVRSEVKAIRVSITD